MLPFSELLLFSEHQDLKMYDRKLLCIIGLSNIKRCEIKKMPTAL